MVKPVLFILFFAVLVLVSAFIVLFSWLPDPLLSNLGWLPQGVAHWADHPSNINIRTAIPMLGWGLLAGMLLAVKPAKRRWWILASLAGTGLLCLAELGQLLIPNRHPDWGDIGWGTLGLAAGLYAAYGFGWGVRSFKPLFLKTKTI